MRQSSEILSLLIFKEVNGTLRVYAMYCLMAFLLLLPTPSYLRSRYPVTDQQFLTEYRRSHITHLSCQRHKDAEICWYHVKRLLGGVAKSDSGWRRSVQQPTEIDLPYLRCTTRRYILIKAGLV